MGCADFTNPTSVLWADHSSCGTVLSIVSCSTVNGSCVGVLSFNITFSANPSSHARKDILTYCLSGDVCICLFLVGVQSCTCSAALTIGPSS